MITSRDNAQVKKVAALREEAKYRARYQQYIVEGPRMLRELPEEDRISVFASESFIKKEENQRLAESVGAETVPDVVFQHMAGTKTPQGILAVARIPSHSLGELLTGGTVMILENLQDPGNLGTILRTGEGAGIRGILADRTTADLYNPKTVRSTMGSLFRVPYVISDNLHEDIGLLKQAGFRVYAAHLKGTKMYTEFSYPSSSAFMIGNEGRGLSDSLAVEADEYLRIPMCGRVESLNAAAASAILMYEVYRQHNIL